MEAGRHETLVTGNHAITPRWPGRHGECGDSRLILSWPCSVASWHLNRRKSGLNMQVSKGREDGNVRGPQVRLIFDSVGTTSNSLFATRDDMVEAADGRRRRAKAGGRGFAKIARIPRQAGTFLIYESGAVSGGPGGLGSERLGGRPRTGERAHVSGPTLTGRRGDLRR